MWRVFPIWFGIQQVSAAILRRNFVLLILYSYRAS